MSLLLKRLSLAAALAGGVATFNTVPASAQTIQTQVLGGPGQIIRLDTGASQVQDVTLSRGKSVPVNFNGSVRNTAVSDPCGGRPFAHVARPVHPDRQGAGPYRHPVL
jgi:hypothetical protein